MSATPKERKALQNLMNTWQSVYENAYKPLQDGEKIASMIAKDLNIDSRTAERMIKLWIANKTLEYVGERWIPRRGPVKAYKPVI